MVSFDIGEDLEGFRQELRKLVEGRFKEKAAYWDEHEEFPEENKKILAELGYLGTLVPEEYGGQGGSILQGAIFVEELARVCFNTSLIAQLYLNGPSRAISILGTEDQKKRWLPGSCSGEFFHSIGISEPHAGSAVTDLKTTATRDGDHMVVNGAKCFVTGGHLCTHIFIFARLPGTEGSRGIGAMIIDKGTPGFEIGKPDRKMGGRGMGEAQAFFDDCRVPLENVIVEFDGESSKGFKKLMHSFGPERVGNAAMCLGVAQGAFETALEYTKEREQFGRPIMEFQGIQWMIADMWTKIHGARLMVYRAATNLKDGFPDALDCAVAKLHANEMAVAVTNDALQLHGHYGFVRDYPLERMVRDARGFSLGGGTTQILRNTIAAMKYGRTFDQRRG